MTPEQKAAFVIAQSACAFSARAAMMTQNGLDAAARRPPTYKPADFMALLDTYVIGHNAVIDFFRE